jgi:hypothetical protein
MVGCRIFSLERRRRKNFSVLGPKEIGVSDGYASWPSG